MRDFNLNQSQLALVLGVPKSSVTNWLREHRNPCPGSRRCIWLVDRYVRQHGAKALLELALWQD